ncbi:MAG: hypothetical protein U0797_19665 [Gemmataceae bacterium]
MWMVVCLVGFVAYDSPEQLGEPTPVGAVARLGSPRYRLHPNSYRPVISPDGRWVLASGDTEVFAADKGIRLPYRLRQPYPDSRHEFRPDGLLALRVKNQGRAELWVVDPATGKTLRSATLPVERADLSFSRTGRVAVTRLWSDGEGVIAIHDEATGKLVTSVRTGLLRISFVALSGDGKWLATSGEVSTGRKTNSPHEIRIWEVESGNWVSSFGAANRIPRVAAFSRDAKTLIVSRDSTIELWDWRAKRVIRAFASEGGGSVLHWSHDGPVLAANYSSQRARLWNLDSGKYTVTNWTSFRSPTSVGFRPDGRVLGCEVDGNTYALRDLRTGRVVRETSGHRSGISDLCFPRRDRLTSIDEGGSLGVWDLPEGKARMSRLVNPTEDTRNRRPFGLLRLSPGGGWVVSHKDPLKTVYRFGDGQLVFQTETSGSRATPSFHGESSFAAFDFENGERRVHLYNLPSGERVASIPVSVPKETAGLNAGVRSFALSEPSRPLLAVNADTPGGLKSDLHVLDATGKPLAGFRPLRQEETPGDPQFDRSGRLLLAGVESHRLHVLNANTGRILQAIGIDRLEQKSTLFSPPGTMIAVTCFAERWGRLFRRVELWEAATGKLLCWLPETDRSINAVAFSPCGRYLASGEDGGLIYVWDLAFPWPSSGVESPGNLWAALDGDDQGAAFAAMGTLARSPNVALELFRERLRPAETAKPALMRRLISQLDSDNYTTRELGRAQLERMGDTAEPALRAALADRPSAEVKRQVTKLLDAIARSPYPRRLVRPLRAVTVLGWIGTAEALSLLRELSGGDPDSPLTWAAGAALRAGVEARRAK